MCKPTDIHKALIAHGRKHFSQAHGTPPTVSPLKNIIGENPGAKQDAVLRGDKVLPPVLDPIMCQLYDNMKRSIPEAPSSIIPKTSIIHAFKVWTE